jgi:hypothetical protein
MGLLAIVEFGSNPSSSSRQNGITSVVWSIEFIKNQQFWFFEYFRVIELLVCKHGKCGKYC